MQLGSFTAPWFSVQVETPRRRVALVVGAGEGPVAHGRAVATGAQGELGAGLRREGDLVEGGDALHLVLWYLHLVDGEVAAVAGGERHADGHLAKVEVARRRHDLGDGTGL